MNESIQSMDDRPRENDLARLEGRLRRLADAFQGTLAVAARDVRTGASVRLNADRPMSTASVIKLAVLVTVFDRARAGGLSLEDRVTLRADDRVGGSGVIHELSEGTALTVRDLATLMIVVSDNMATNLLIDAVGGVAVVDELVQGELGLRSITLRRKLTFSDSDRGPLGLAAPEDLIALLDGLLAGRIVSEEASREMLGMLSRQQFLDQVPRLLDGERRDDQPGPQAELAVAAKTGMIDGVRADAGVLWLGGHPVTYAVMSETGGDGGLDLDADAQLVNAEVGRLLVEGLWPGDRPPLAPHPAARWARLLAATTDRPAG